MPPVVLAIAGFDPSSGAGVTADIKTIAAHGCYGVSCITALTVQSTVAVRLVQPVSATLVRHTLEELADDLPLAAIKIGMLGSGEVARMVAEWLEQMAAKTGHLPVVLDPIMRSSSGTDLLEEGGVEVLRSRLLPLASVITPNLDEAAVLTGRAVLTQDDMRAAAARLHELGAKAVVLKGGHLEGAEAADLLSVKGEQRFFRAAKLTSRATHGTGCAFATALACNLALDRPMVEAVEAAKSYVAIAIVRAYPLGHGHGPLNHLFKFDDH